MMQNNNTQAPPPAYQGGQQPGQTYYQPPPAPEGGYAPPPPTNNNNMGGVNGVGQRFTQFYSPPQNRKLGLKRRICSCICCCIIIGLIIGLAAGLTTNSRRYYNTNNTRCNCRTNSDCTIVYGSGTYCYAGCQCARR